MLQGMQRNGLKKLNINSCSFKALRKIIIIPSLLISANIFAQRPPTGLWLAVHLPVRLSNKWQWHNDGGYRTLGNSIAPLQYFYRTGLRYNITGHWNTAAGVALFYSRIGFKKEFNEFAREFRFWEEANYQTAVGKNSQWQSRLRIEQRTFSQSSIKETYHAFRFRVRTQLQQKISEKWSVIIADEYMQQYAHSKWSFDQNRIIVNGIYSLGGQAQLNAGYMWLLWPGSSSQHIIILGFQKTISLHAKQ